VTSALNEVAYEFSGRLFRAGVGVMELLSIEIGLKLGFWDTLNDLGPTTSAELAAARRTEERRTRQWLEQQAVCGYLAVEGLSASPEERRYCLLPGLDCVLLDPDDPLAMSEMAGLSARLSRLLPITFDAFRPRLSLLADGDACLRMNEPQGEPLPCPGDEQQRFRYLCSVLQCPYVSVAEQNVRLHRPGLSKPSAAPG
jgi:hypothetical protein